MPFVTQDDIDEKEKRRPAPGSTDALIQSWQEPEPTAQLLPWKPSGTPARGTPSNGGTNQSPSAMPTIQRDQPASIREMPLTPQPGMDTRPPVSSIMPSIVSAPPPAPSSGRSPLHIIGEIGRGVGSAVGQVVAPWAMPFIPGTVQHQWLEQGQERSKERFGTEQEEAKARITREQAQTDELRQRTKNENKEPFIGDPNFVQYGKWEAEKDALQAANPGMSEADAEHQLTIKWAQEGKGGAPPTPPKTVESGGQAYEFNPETKKFDIPVGAPKPVKPDIVTTEGGKMWEATPGQPLKPVMEPGQIMPPIGQPGEVGAVPAAPMAPQQAIAQPKEPAPKTASDVNESIANFFKLKGYNPDPASPDYAKHWQEAHQAYTNETKTEPGVVRIEALGETRGIPVTDATTGITAPMNWNDYNRLSKQFPGRYSSPAFDESVQAAITAARGGAPKNTGQQVQSYGTFVRHAGDLYSAIDSLKNTDAPLLNRPINWLRTNTGDPRVRAFVAKLDPVQKEFESFLLNNRALYEEDRKQASSILDENTTPAQMYAVLPSLVHTGTIRLEETNEAYKRSTGKDFPELVSPEAARVFKQMNVAPPNVKPSEVGGAGAEPVVQHNPKTGAYRYSTDGGKSWQPGQPPQPKGQ